MLSVKAEVESSNIVGYQKITVPANAMDIIGVQFQEVGGGAISLQDIVPTGYSEEGVDWVKVWNPTTRRYVQAFYWGESAEGGVYESAEAEEPLGPGWGDGEQNVIYADLANGQGFWTQAVVGGSLTIAGEVAANAVTIPVNAMTLVTSTYPGEISLQDVVPTGYSEEGVDWVKVWNPTTRRYVQAFYWGESAEGGVYESAEAEEPLGPGWGDGEQNVVNATISQGQGFWTQAVNGGALTFPQVD